MYKFNTIPEAIADFKKGKMIVIVDDEDRENEGDLVVAAEKATPQVINFMAKYGGGLVCLPVIRERLEELAYRKDGSQEYRSKPNGIYSFH